MRSTLHEHDAEFFSCDARIKFVPAGKSQYGLVAFDFESEGLIQGGMNTEGLFFDGTATPFVPLDFTGKEEFKGTDFWLALLQTCRSVQDAINFIKKYKVPDLEKVHIFLADKSGQSVIVGAYDGVLTFTPRVGNYQVLTNFNITDPEYGGEQPCPRYGKANEILVANGKATIETVKKVLENTTQGKLTVYSNIYDLNTGSVTIFSEADFSKSRTYNVSAELSNGPHATLITEALKN